jgi:two-component system sensor histidine kinase YesM
VINSLYKLDHSLRWFNSWSIQRQIMAAFAVIILPLLAVVGWIVFNRSASSITQITAQYSEQITQQISQNIEQYIRSMDDLSSTLYWDPDLRNFLSVPKLSTQGITPLNMERVQGWLATVPKIRSDIRAIYVFGRDGRVLMRPGSGTLKPWVNYMAMSWYQNALLAQGASVVSSSHVQNLFLNQYPWVVSLSRAIIDSNTGQILGVILIELNFRVIHDICNQVTLGSRGYVFIVDHVGSIVYHPQQQLVYNGFKTENIQRIIHTQVGTFIDNEENEKRLVTVCTSRATGWRIVGVGYTKDLLAVTNSLRNTIIFACLIALVGGLGISIFLASRIAKPIRRLEQTMHRVEAGQLGITVPITAQYEIAALEEAFNLMSERIHDLLIQTHREQEAKRKSELRVLQAQINPHFLYNTLDSVVWMAEGGRQKDVVTMVSALAKLFRRALSGGRDLISIADEIEHVQNYLIIQKIRYGERFDYCFDIAPEVNQVQTPKLLLQPLVENAIYHGIKHMENEGKINIRGYAIADELILEVEDNGVGIPPERLINWRQSPSSSKSSFGLTNIEERIQLYFGEQYGLTIESEPDVGTKVKVRLPLKIISELNNEKS